MIERFYNSTCYIMSYSISTDNYGEEIKTWLVSTYVLGIKQGESGNVSIVENKQGVRLNEMFYCNYFAMDSNYRLAFSTKVNYFQSNSTSSTQLNSTVDGALYFMKNDSSTYLANNFYRFLSTGYSKESFKYFKVNYVNNLEDRHLEINIEEDNENRI